MKNIRKSRDDENDESKEDDDDFAEVDGQELIFCRKNYSGEAN